MTSSKAVVFFLFPSLTLCGCTFHAYKILGRTTKEEEKINVIEHCVATAMASVDTVV